MKLKEFYGEKVHIVDANGDSFFGEVNDYFFPEDNENGTESIIVDIENGEPTEFYPQEIKTIKIID